MVTPHEPVLRADEAGLAAAVGVLMETLGLTAQEAFAWIMDEAVLTGLPIFDLADLVVHDATRAVL